MQEAELATQISYLGSHKPPCRGFQGKDRDFASTFQSNASASLRTGLEFTVRNRQVSVTLLSGYEAHAFREATPKALPVFAESTLLAIMIISGLSVDARGEVCEC
jgi:hypothetical protein